VPRILIDCDTGVDDAITLFYLAKLIRRGDVELIAAGSVHGNVTAEVGALNTLRVLELAGHGDVPVTVGAARPMAQPLHVATAVHGDDGLGQTYPPAPAGRPAEGTAAEQIVRLARAHPGELTLLAIGPLTNLGLALLLDPELPALVREVVVMGGALDYAGNITSHAEANIWHDPEAAELVLSAGWPVVLVPLDATMPTEVGPEWLDRLAAADGEIARFSAGVIEHYAGYYTRWLGRRTCVIHDALAAMIAVDPAIARYEEAPVRVELRGEHTRGSTVWDRRPPILDVPPDTRPVVKVAVGCDVAAFQDRLLASLL
jgi:purine nucleosidase